MYNPDGKEMIARDNEISLLRKEDPSKAYFGVHNDITIPYNEMAKVTAVHADGTRVDLISDGRVCASGSGRVKPAPGALRAVKRGSLRPAKGRSSCLPKGEDLPRGRAKIAT